MRRGCDQNLKILEKVFKSKVIEKYSEVLFSPELKMGIGSKQSSYIGFIDRYLTSHSYLTKLFARQHSFHISKK